MATLVMHKRTAKKYVLVVAGFGAFQSKKPNWLLGDLMADTTEGQYAMVCVAAADGCIYWLDSTELIVDSVDGESPATLINETA